MIIGSITITSLDPIGNAVAGDTLIPVVNMDGVPTTQKMTVANLMQVGIGANLGEVSNVIITGGTNGQFLQTDGEGNLSWSTASGGGGNGSPGGANTQVQFNDAGDFGGNAGFTFNKVAGSLSSPMIDTATVYHLAGTVIENADLTHGATSALIIPGNGNTSVPAQLTNTYGNVVVTTGVDPDNLKSWNFDKTGNLTAPGNVNAAGTLRGTSVYVTSTGTAINASQGNILTNEVTGTKINFLTGSYTASITSGATANYTLTLPTTAGSNGQVLTTDGSGNLSWTTGSSGNTTSLVNGNNSFVLNSDGDVTFEGNVAGQGINRGLIWDYGANANGVNSTVVQNNDGITVRAWTENGGGANGYSAPVNIVTNQDATAKTWTFDGSGNLTLAGNIQSVSTGFAFSGTITNIQSFAYPTPPVITIAEQLFEGPATGQVTISNLSPSTGALQANGTWYYQAESIDQFTLYTDAALTEPVDTSSWTAYEGPGGNAVSFGEYTDFTIRGGNVSVGSNGNTWTFDTNGDINIPSGASSFNYGRIQSANGYPTLLGYGTDGTGGPELDWANTDNPNDISNASIIRNTLYINGGGLYVGMNENGFDVANNFSGSWRFGSGGSLTIPAGDANNINSGQIFSDNESGFINLDVQFASDVLGGVRLGTSSAKPVDIMTGTGSFGENNIWRFDSNGGISFPYQPTNQRTGYANALMFAKSTTQKVIGTQPGNSINGVVERLVVAGGDGFDGGEGGDIYLWAGNSGANGGSGGDIKVDGGSGYNGSEGGTIKIRGGQSYDNGNGGGYGGFVEIYAGGGKYGAPVDIRAGQGDSQANSGNITLSTVYGGTWTFGRDGNLITPGNIITNGKVITGLIQGDITTTVSDGINAIYLGTSTAIDVFAFPFTTLTRGTLTISGDISTIQAIGTWYYQSVNTNTMVLYTDSTYSTTVDSTTWTPYTGGGTVDITKNISATNVSINTNGFVSTFSNDGNLTVPEAIIANTVAVIGNLSAAQYASPAPSINGFDNATFTGIVKTGVFVTGTIPSASTSGAGARAFVTDADSVAFGAPYVGGSGNAMPVWSNGTDWFIG